MKISISQILDAFIFTIFTILSLNFVFSAYFHQQNVKNHYKNVKMIQDSDFDPVVLDNLKGDGVTASPLNDSNFSTWVIRSERRTEFYFLSYQRDDVLETVVTRDIR